MIDKIPEGKAVVYFLRYSYDRPAFFGQRDYIGAYTNNPDDEAFIHEFKTKDYVYKIFSPGEITVVSFYGSREGGNIMFSVKYCINGSKKFEISANQEYFVSSSFNMDKKENLNEKQFKEISKCIFNLRNVDINQSFSKSDEGSCGFYKRIGTKIF